MRAELKSGDIKISEVIARATADEAIAKLKVVSLLEALPGVGKAKAATIMARHHIAVSWGVGGLVQHLRVALTREFGCPPDR